MQNTIINASREDAPRDMDKAARERLSSDAPSNATKSVMRFIAPLIVLLAVTLVYGAIYYREESIATGIGANLVPAERVLKGEVPYRDFYKIQTPGILLLNAGLFKWFGTTLITALGGVLVFKALSLMLIFLIARRVLSSALIALAPTLLALVWLPPGGPFRPAPIQYEMLFILAAIFFTLLWLDSKRAIHLFFAGLAVGMVAVFKQNVGVYAGVALGLSYVLHTRGLPRSFKEAKQIYLDSWKNGGVRMHLAAGLGFILPLAAMVIYLLSHHALGAALRVFLKGPGEHLQMKFTGYPLPKYAGLIFIAAAIAIAVASRFARGKPKLANLIYVAVITGALACALFAPQAAIDNTIFWFAPALFAYAAWCYLRSSRDAQSEFADGQRARGVLLVLLMFALASFGEVFPRSVRGLAIGTMPPAFILMAFLFARNCSLTRTDESEPAKPQKQAASTTQRLAFAVAAVVLTAFALRTILPHYVHFDSARGLRFRADTELGFDRGRGIYLPGKRAEEVNAMIALIQSRVVDGGYCFAHALDATSYYFLADRNSPTGATLWNDAGTNNAERARTVAALQEKQVRLVLTSEQAMQNERYQPLLDLLQNDFHPTETIGKVIFLERNN